MSATHNAQRASRTVRWALGVGIAIVTALALVLFFLLTLTTNNRVLYERNYTWLFGVNVGVAAVLLAVLGWMVLRLLLRLKRGRFGSRLLVKLAAIFALVGLVPGALIYFVSYQFVSRSIESWFDVKVEGALSAGVSLASVTLEMQASDTATRLRSFAAPLAQTPDATAGIVLERIRDQLGASDLLLWNAAGSLVASAGQSRYRIDQERPPAALLRMVRQQKALGLIEGLEEQPDSATPDTLRKVRITALAAITSSSMGMGLVGETRYLQATVPMPEVLIANAVAVQEANREYQERALARSGLRRMYIGTLTLSLFLAVFGAMLLAVLLGNQLARPLLVLAEGVREVTQGNLSPKAFLPGKDELGGLTRSFATMTQQLADARSEVERSMAAVDAARGGLQTILDNLTAGVIVLDAAGVIQSSNPGAARILGVSLESHVGQSLADVAGLQTFAQGVQQQFDAFMGHRSPQGADHWQQAFELHPHGAAPAHGVAAAHTTNLVARGAALPDGARLLVFDDITEIVSAQRAQAWGEVARRLAHEIKNPLTPIQLSAERLEMKLQDKLQAPEQAVLSKSVKTIVEQVDAMKRLVNEFRDYARLPAAELKPVDLNALITDILHLYEAEHAAVAVRAELDPQCPRILGDAQQLRQVVHNLLQNAQDATEQAGAGDAAQGYAPVCISTQWREAARRVRLVVSDHGSGFPAHILQRAFEPYVTTKARGTGLGLAVVKKIADEHGARIELLNRQEEGVVRGAQVSLSFAPEQIVAS